MKRFCRWFFAAACTAALLLSSHDAVVARFPHGSAASAGVHGWNTYKIGAGGQVISVDYPTSSSPFLIGTDTGGAYALNKNTNVWVQLITKTALGNTSVLDKELWMNGVYAIVSAPSDPTRAYLFYSDAANGTSKIFISNNANASDPSTITWTDSGLSGFGHFYSNVGSKFYGPRAGVDPVNKNVVYWGTLANGQFLSTDGCATKITIPSVTASSNSGAIGFAFDQGSGTVSTALGGNSPTRTKNVWLASQGAGVWQSTDGGVSFTHLTTGTGPATPISSGKLASDGVYYATELGGNAWRYKSGTWENISTVGTNPPSPGQPYFVGVAPFANSTPGTVVIGNGAGSLWMSTNANTATASNIVWTGTSQAPIRATADIPWFTNPASPSAQDYLTIADIIMDPITAGKWWGASGVGIWYTTSTTGQTNWNGASAGIEQIVVNKIISPPGGNPVMGGWDRATFLLDGATTYKSGYGPNYINNIEKTDGIDFAWATPSYIAIINNGYGPYSGYSTTGGGPTSWTSFAAVPTGASLASTPNATALKIGGMLSVSSGGATTANIVWAQANGGDIHYTLNGGGTWTKTPAANFTNANNASITGAGLTPGAQTGLALALIANVSTMSNVGGFIQFAVNSTAGMANGDTVQFYSTDSAQNALTGGYIYSGTVTSFVANTSVLSNIAWPSPSPLTGFLIDAVSGSGGWNFNYNVDRQSVAPDRTTTNVHFTFNSALTNAAGGGFYKTTDGGANWLRVLPQFANGNEIGGFVNQLHTIPGRANEFFYAVGQNVGSLWYYREPSGVPTIVAISGVTDVYQVGTGAIKPGNDFPSVYVVGTVGTTYSVYRSDNSAAQWAANTVTWTDLGLPNQSFDQPTTLTGDNNTWGVVYFGGKAITMQYYTP